MRILMAGLFALWLWVGSAAAVWAMDSGDGAPLFQIHCAGCHINGGNIIRRGKTLQPKALERNGYDSLEAIAQLVTQGKGTMPAYAERMSAPEIQAVAAYVLEQAANHWKS